MSLIIPRPPSWTYTASNLSGTPSNTNPGTTVTPGTSNANGSTATVISAISRDVEYLVVAFAGTQTTASINCTHVDIMIDPAGGTSWASTPLIEGLLFGGCAAGSGTLAPAMRYHFPIWIKSGTSIGARARTTHTVAPTNPRMIMDVYGGNSNPASWWCGQKVEAIGTTIATCNGTSHTAGNSGAYSTWANFGSTTTGRAGAIQYGVQIRANSHNALGYYFEFGVGDVKIGGTKCVTTTTAEACAHHSDTGVIFCDLPSGTQLKVRGTCSGTAQAMDVAAYVVT